MKLNPIKVAPIQKRLTRGFQSGPDGCGYAEWDEPVFPLSPDGDALRQIRFDAPDHIYLGEAARHVGLTAEQVSGLERGRYTLTEPEWNWLLGEMGRLAAGKAAP